MEQMIQSSRLPRVGGPSATPGARRARGQRMRRTGTNGQRQGGKTSPGRAPAGCWPRGIWSTAPLEPESRSALFVPWSFARKRRASLGADGLLRRPARSVGKAVSECHLSIEHAAAHSGITVGPTEPLAEPINLVRTAPRPRHDSSIPARSRPASGWLLTRRPSTCNGPLSTAFRAPEASRRTCTPAHRSSHPTRASGLSARSSRTRSWRPEGRGRSIHYHPR